MKKLWLIVFIIFLSMVASLFFLGKNFLTGSVVSEDNAVSEDVEFSKHELAIHMFYGQGCPHCASMHELLKDFSDEYPNLIVKEHEVYFNSDERKLFYEMAEAFGVDIEGVPMIFIDEKVFVGAGTSTKDYLKNEIERCLSQGCADPEERINGGVGNVTAVTGETDPFENPEKTALKEKLTIPAVLSAAAVDAINPCAFAVLIILLTTILAAKVKKRVLMAGLAFTFSIFISYYLMGIGLYSAIQATGISHAFFIVVGFLAIVLGLFNLKDFLWYGKWFVMEVPMSWRPKLKSLLRGVTSVPGAFLIGFVVSLFLLPCTSGPYIVILGLLSKLATRNYALFLLLIYNLIFVLPMLIITLVIYFGFTTVEKAEEWRKSKLKFLHLIAGLILLVLGIAMLISVFMGWI